MTIDLTLAAVICGFILDIIIGDPRRLYHPVRLIGKLIDGLEWLMRKIFPDTKKGLRAGGAILMFLVFLISGAVPFAFLWLCFWINKWLGFAFEIIMCWQLLAVKSLKDESMKVYKALKEGTIEDARYAVSMIVGRDTQALSEEGVTKAAVETVAESSSDGIIAPLFYMMIGGPVLGWMYKSVNTMDSMIGYKNDKYRYFGTWAAKFDDVLNFIPARLAGLIMVLAGFICGLDGKNAWKIFKRDRKNHKSPNSAHTESVMAGALDVQLAGDAYYFGKLVKKPTIGDPIRKVGPEDIRRANRLMYATAILAVLIFGLIRFLIVFFISIL